MSFTLIMYLLAIHSAEFFKKMDNLYFEIFGRTHKILNIVNYENLNKLMLSLLRNGSSKSQGHHAQHHQRSTLICN